MVRHLAAAASQAEANPMGTASFQQPNALRCQQQRRLVVIGRSFEVVIHDEIGRERERHKYLTVQSCCVQDGEAIKAGQTLATLGSAYPSDDYRTCRFG